MAEIAKTLIGFGSLSAAMTTTAATGADSFAANNADGRMTLLIQNQNASQAATITIKAGDGVLASRGDATVTVVAGKIAAVPLARLESARVKVTKGGSKGLVNVTSSVEAGGSLASVLLAVLSVQ